jgi:hypothetical protein
MYFGIDMAIGPDGQVMILDEDLAVDAAVDDQVLLSAQLALDLHGLSDGGGLDRAAHLRAGRAGCRRLLRRRRVVRVLVFLPKRHGAETSYPAMGEADLGPKWPALLPSFCDHVPGGQRRRRRTRDPTLI